MKTTRSYAQDTTVSVSKSKVEIETLLTRHGATRFCSGWEQERAAVAFEMKGLHLRFTLPLPTVDDPMFDTDGRGTRSQERRAAACEAEHRRRWRCLGLVLKAKLEAVASGVSDFQNEFLAFIVIPGGKTVGEWAAPQLARAYKEGVEMPPMLGA